MYATTLNYLCIQHDQTNVIRNWRCRQRIPGISNLHDAMGVPSSQGGLKYNWAVAQVSDRPRTWCTPTPCTFHWVRC